MRIKVCGVTRPRDARLAAELGAWAVGMIFVPNTPRYLSPARARRVRAAVPKGVLAVGVFRNASEDQIRAAVKSLRLDAVQIEGPVPEKIGIPVLRVASPRARVLLGRRDFLLVEPPRTPADRRAGRVPSDAARRAVQRAASRRRGVRVIVAGGLNPENVADAVAARPWAVDVSSGVESRPGIKDAKRLRAFFDAANRRRKNA